MKKTNMKIVTMDELPKPSDLYEDKTEEYGGI